MQGYKHQKAYIIAEGPMESTARNMWKVVYDRKCGAIVMLSDLVENGMVNPFNRWRGGGGGENYPTILAANSHFVTNDKKSKSLTALSSLQRQPYNGIECPKACRKYQQ